MEIIFRGLLLDRFFPEGHEAVPAEGDLDQLPAFPTFTVQQVG